MKNQRLNPINSSIIGNNYINPQNGILNVDQSSDNSVLYNNVNNIENNSQIQSEQSSILNDSAILKMYDKNNNKIFDNLENKIENSQPIPTSSSDLNSVSGIIPVSENNYIRILISVNDSAQFLDNGNGSQISNANQISNTISNTYMNQNANTNQFTNQTTHIVVNFLISNGCEIYNIVYDPDKLGSEFISAGIPLNNTSIIYSIPKDFPEIIYIKEESTGTPEMQQALMQGQIYPEIRDQYGLSGDNNSAIAFIDSGIDVTNPMLLGYGDKDPTKKVIGWVDFTSEHNSTPYDPDGHGTFASSVAAGLPYNQTDSLDRRVMTESVRRDWTGFEFNTSILYLDLLCSMNVSKSGIITVNGTWQKGDSSSQITVEKLVLIDPEGNYAANVSLYGQNNNTILNFNVNSSTLGVYKVGCVFNVTGNSDDSYFIYSDVHYPLTTSYPTPVMQGVAPNAKIVMLKVYYESEYIQAFEWILANGTKYNITTVNMSFKIDSPQIAALAAELVSHGFISIAAAGNDYPGENMAGSMENTPGSVDSVLSVGAVDNNNHITSYSSEGGPSPTGLTIKPDCVAPGGEFPGRYNDYLQITAADNNGLQYLGSSGNINFTAPERIANDTTTDVGTSFSCAYTSGVSQLIVQALGGVKNWNYTANEALKVKSYILMTATETWPNPRNWPGDYNPVLNRGGKDVEEGYGKINPKAIIDMLENSFKSNTTQNSFLASVAENNSYLPTCFARNVTLLSNHYYDFNLSVPINADFDLYLYSNEPDQFGQPIILDSSTQNATGNMESFQFSPIKSGIYYIIVKAVLGEGVFNLTLNNYLDISPPDLAQVISPQNGQYVGSNLPVNVNFQDEQTRITSIKIYFVLVDNLTKFRVLNTTQLNSVTYNNSFSIDTGLLKDGWYDLILTAVDANGNGLNSSKILLCIDNTPPNIVYLTEPIANRTYYGNIEISGNASDALSGISYVEVFAFSRNESIYIDHNPQNGINFTWSSSYVDDGFNYIWLRAYDKAGNYRDSISVPLYIDNKEVVTIELSILFSILGFLTIGAYKMAEKILLTVDLGDIPEKILKIRNTARTLFSNYEKEFKMPKRWKRHRNPNFELT